MTFSKWKNSRPFTAAILTVLSGALITWAPLNVILTAFLPGTISVLGVLFGGLIILLGVLSLFSPKSCVPLGVLTIFLAILAIIGALGGFLIGTILGIIGGALMAAWRYDQEMPVEMEENKDSGFIPAGMADAK